MNILYHHRTQGCGVEGVHINEVVNALKSLGHNVDVLSPAGLNYNAEAVSDKTMRSVIFRFITKSLPEFMFELMEIVYNYVSYRNISRQIKTNKYDFIYERYAIFGIAGALAARKYSVPILCEINYTSWSPLVRKRSALLMPFAKYIDKRIFRLRGLLDRVVSGVHAYPHTDQPSGCAMSVESPSKGNGLCCRLNRQKG